MVHTFYTDVSIKKEERKQESKLASVNNGRLPSARVKGIKADIRIADI